MSELENVMSGLIAGSAIGPLLFILTVNDLLIVIKYCIVYIFADDIQLLVKGVSINSRSLILIVLNSAGDWCIRNHYQIYPSNSSLLVYGPEPTGIPYILNRTSIVGVNEVRDLGVIRASNSS